MKNRVQWEYCEVSTNTIFFYQTQERILISPTHSLTFEEQRKAIAQLGMDGWELTAVNGEGHISRTFYLKRPL